MKNWSILTFCYPASAGARREVSTQYGLASRGPHHPIFWSFKVLVHFTAAALLLLDSVWMRSPPFCFPTSSLTPDF